MGPESRGISFHVIVVIVILVKDKKHSEELQSFNRQGERLNPQIAILRQRNELQKSRQ